MSFYSKEAVSSVMGKKLHRFGDRTHDDSFSKLHPEIHHRTTRDTHNRIGFGGEEPPLYNRPRFQR